MAIIRRKNTMETSVITVTEPVVKPHDALCVRAERLARHSFPLVRSAVCRKQRTENPLSNRMRVKRGWKRTTLTKWIRQFGKQHT